MARNSEIFLGGDNSTLIYLGEEEHKIYLGSDLVYQPKISIATATVSVGSKTYNGSKQTASSITVTLSGNTLTVGEDYQITANSGGTNVGNYTVTVTGIGLYKDAASGTFTINKVTPTVTAPTPKVLTYNGEAQVLANAGSTNFGTLRYSLDNSTWKSEIPSATNQGSYTVYYRVDGDSNVNSVAAQTISCSINEKQVTATVELSQSTYTYNGSACTPTVTVKDGSTVIPASEYTVTYSNNINAGTATVTINDNVGGNYDVIGSANFTINKAAASISYATTTVGKTYGDSAFTNTLTKTGDGSVTYSSSNTDIATVNSSSGQVTIKAAGSATITATVADGANYTYATKTASYTLNVAKATPSVTPPTAKDLTYNGSAQTLINAGSTTGGTIQYKLGTGTYSTSLPSATNKESYTVYYKVVGNSNYNDVAEASITVNIKAKSLTITAKDQTVSYGTAITQGTDQVTVSGLVSGDALTAITLTQSTVDVTTNGTITPSAGATTKGIGNYSVTYTNGKLTITAVEPVKVDPVKIGNLTYNGSAQALINAGSSSHGTFTYKLSTASTYGSSIPTGTNAGTYTVDWKFVADANHGGETVTGTITGISIAQKSLTIAAKSQSVVYGTAITQGTNQVTVTGLVSGDALTAVTLTQSTVNVTTTGTITPSAAATTNGIGNYSVIYDTANLTITQKALTITAKAQTVNYGTAITQGVDQVTVSGLISGDSLTAITLTQSTVNVTTTGTITPSAAATTNGISNYSVTYNTGNLTINSVSATVTKKPTAKSLTYNTEEQPLVNAGTANGGTMYYQMTTSNSKPSSTSGFSETIPTGTNAGTYYVWYYAKGDSNHTDTAISETAVTVTIANKAIVIPTPTDVSKTYDGTAASATFGTATGATITKYRYSTDNSSWTESSSNPTQTEYGTLYTQAYYTASANYTGSGWSSSATISIAKAAPTYTAPTTKTGLVYNGSAQALLNAGSTSHGTIQYSSDNSTWSTTIPAGTNVNTYTSYWRLVGDKNHTDVASKSLSTTISKVTPTVTAPTAKTLTYNGSAQTLANAGTTNFGTLKYSLDNSTWSTSVPTATNQGSYTVYYKVDGDSNINSVATQNISCSINEKQVTATVELSQSTYTYSGSACEPTVTVKDGGTVIPASEYTVTYSNNVNVGTATVTITDNVGGNYEVIGSATFAINKANPTYTAPTGKTGLVYNGDNQALLNAGSTSHGTIQYSSDNSTWNTTIPVQKNAASYDVYWKLIGDGNHNSVNSTKITVAIAQKEVTLNWGTTSWTYDKTEHSTTCTAGSLISGDTCYVNLTGNSITNVGSTTVIASSLGNSNYALPSENTNTLTVSAKTVTLTWGTTSWTYDKSAHSTTCTLGNIVSGDSCTVTLTGNSITNVGSTTVTASSLSNTNYALPSENTTTITVTARTVTLNWGTLSWVYDGSAHTTTCTAGNVVSGDTCTVTMTGNSITNVGTATVTASSLSNSNYALPSEKTTTITVTARPINVTAGSTSKTYDGTALTYNSATAESTGTNRGLVSGHAMDSCTVTGTITTKGSTNNVPSAAVIKSGTTNVTSNYDITYVNGTLTINAKAVTSTATDESWTYDGSEHSASNTGTTTDLPTGHTATYACTGSITNAGTATKTLSTVTIKNSSNVDVTSSFTITKNNGTLTVNKANISPSVSMNNWVWGETAQSPSVSGNTGGGSVTYTYMYPGTSTYSSTAPVSTSDIGTYTVKASITASANYNAGEATNTFSILTNFKPNGSDALITSNSQYFEANT